MSRVGQVTAEVLLYEDPSAYAYMHHLETLIRESTEARVYVHHLELIVLPGVDSSAPGKKFIAVTTHTPLSPTKTTRSYSHTNYRKVDYMAVGRILTLPATIASGQSLSSAVRLEDCAVVAVTTPSSMTGTSLTFQASNDGTTFNNLYKDDGTEYTVTCAASRHILIDPTYFMGARYLKARTGTASSPSTQSSAVCISVMGREM